MVGVYVAATAVLAAGTVVLVRDRQDDGGGNRTIAVSELPDLAPMPYPTVIDIEDSPSGTIGTQFEVSATSFSADPVAKVDLYDGARRVARVDASTSSSSSSDRSSASITYPALSVGSHVLHAEVTDTKGKVSKSPTATVAVTAAPTNRGVVAIEDKKAGKVSEAVPADSPEVVSIPVTPEAGETIALMAERIGVTPAQIALTREVGGEVDDIPGLKPTVKIPAGALALVSVKPNAGAAPSSKAVIVDNPVTGVPGTMSLTAKADGCDAVLTSSNGKGKVSYFDGNAGATGWAEVGQTDGDGDLKLVAPTPGTHVYFARTATRTSQSVSVRVPFSCGGETGWSGDARIVDSKLYLPPKAIGRVYLYLQVDGNTGVRIPEDKGLQGRALNAGYVTDISSLLPDLAGLAGSTAELSVWSAGEFPMEVAKGSLKVPEGRTLVEIVGEPGAIDLVAEVPKQGINPLSSPTGVVLFHQDKELTFQWESASNRVDEVLWQVVSKSPSDGTSPESSAVLVAGISEAGDAADGTGKAGSFSFDTKDIPGHGQKIDPDAIKKLTVVKPAVTPGTLHSLKGQSVAKPVAEGLVAAAAAGAGAGTEAIELPGPGAQLFVRVTANPNGPAMGTSSNVVSVTLPTPEPPESAGTSVNMKIDSFSLDPGRAPSSEYVGCAYITMPPYYGDRTLDRKDPRNAAHLVYQEGSGVYCFVPPPPPADDDDCDLDFLGVVGEVGCQAYELTVMISDATTELFKSVYDGISKAYNGVIDGLVDLAGKFNPVCIALKQASKDAAEACVKTSEAVASAIISAVLASFGLPPKLPTLAQLEAIAKGELAALAVALMEQYGVPCSTLKASPEVNEAVDLAGGNVNGYDVREVVADPCLAMVKSLINQATKAVSKKLSATTAAATQLPDFPGLYGFSMKPVRQSLPDPMIVNMTMSPVDPKVDATGLECGVALVPSAPALGGYPDPFTGVTFLKVKEDAPVDGKGSFSGSAAMSSYATEANGFPGPPLSTRLKDLDVTVSVDQAPRGAEGVSYYYDACRAAKGSVTERVRPAEP